MKQERLTEDLLERLLAAEAPEAYLGERDAVIDRALTDYLRELLADRGIKPLRAIASIGCQHHVRVRHLQG